MVKKLSALFLFLHCTVFAAESTWKRTEMPPLLPENAIIEDAVVIPECGYHATKNASRTTVILTPLSPCVGVRVCNADNSEECVDAHMHATNSLHTLRKTIDENITAPENKDLKKLQLTLFTRTDEHEFENCHFAEDSHAKRVEKIIQTIEANFNVVEKTVYYNQTADGLFPGLEDRSIIYIGHKLCRVAPYQRNILNDGYQIALYLEKKMWNMVGFMLYSANPWSIWRAYDTPLYRIKKNNLKKINALPASIEDPIKKYTHPTFVQKACFYSLTAGSGIFAGVIVGTVICALLPCQEKKS